MQSIKVMGMSCEHCREAVTKAIKSVEGVSSVVVDLEDGQARWMPADQIDVQKVKDAIHNAGYETE